jgi:hypothetical protein
VTKYVPGKISKEMNEILCKPYSQEEIERALFMMKHISLKAQMASRQDFFKNTGTW